MCYPDILLQESTIYMHRYVAGRLLSCTGLDKDLNSLSPRLLNALNLYGDAHTMYTKCNLHMNSFIDMG